MDLVKGIRVVRGPSWKWGGQDGGEGSVGTIILDSIGNLASSFSNFPTYERRKTRRVTVNWDNGNKGTYLVGPDGAHDLLVVDSAASGVKHKDVACHSCKMPEIIGMKWQCLDCSADFCSTCFYRIKELHNQHYRAFLRHVTPDSNPMLINLEKTNKLLELCGIYEGAKVKRSRDWLYGGEDDGQIGEAVKVSNNRVSVRWPSGNIFTYRRGVDGKVDLKVVKAAVGGHYDPQWLPTFGAKSSKKEEETMVTTSTHFAVGDEVQIKVNLEEFREKQAELGGWNPQMSKLISQTGYVSEVSTGIVTVQFDGSDRKWYLNPTVLKKISLFSIGQIVRVKDDKETLKALQSKFGTKIAYSVASEIGRVASKVQVKGDEQIYLEGMDLPTKDVPIRPEWIKAVPISTKLHDKFSRMKSDMVDLLIEAAGEGDAYLVRQLVTFHNVPVDSGRKSDGSTALHLACLNGHLDLIRWLILDKKADLEKEDSKGRRAVYFAVKGCQPEVLKLLIWKGAELDPLTKRKKLSPLLKAVTKQFTDCALILIDNICNVNMQDENGDTALHKVSIRSSEMKLFQAIIQCDRVDLTIKNKKGYNIIHAAVVAGNVPVIKLLLERYREKLSIDDVDVRGRTALMMACKRRYYGLIELLVESGADVNKEDSKSDSPIHFLMKKRILNRAPVTSASPNIHRIHTKLYDHDKETLSKYPSLSAVCYLIEKGGKMNFKKGTVDSNLFYLVEVFVKDIDMDMELVVDDESYSPCILCSSRTTSNVFQCCNTTNSFTCSECFSCFKNCPNCKKPLESFHPFWDRQDLSDDDDDYELDDFYLNDAYITSQAITDEVAVQHSEEHLFDDDDEMDDDISLKDVHKPQGVPDEATAHHSLDHNSQKPATSSTDSTSPALLTVISQAIRSSPDTQPLVHRCYPARRTVSAESNALNVLKEISSPSSTTASVASPSEPVGASAGPPLQQQVQFAANLGLGLSSDEQPTNCHSGGRSRKGSYLMQDSLGNTYTKRATGTGHWQCSRKSDGSKNRCTAILVEKEDKFYARGTHRCIKQVSSGLDLPTSSPVASSSSPTSSGSSVNML